MWRASTAISARLQASVRGPLRRLPVSYSTDTPASTAVTDETEPLKREAWLYIDSIFPIQLGRWDLRHYIGVLRSEILLATLKSRLQSVDIHGLKIITLEPQQKDGGVFVKFSYHPTFDDKLALEEIEKTLQEECSKHGGLPSWSGIPIGSAWLVKGVPWKEDMYRFPSPFLKISFEGPDVHEQTLYELLRPYGRIENLTSPTPVPAGSLRSCVVSFRQLRSATIARNVIHGLKVPSDPSFGSATEGTNTRLRALYQRPIQAHVIRDWMSSHPRIMLPLIVFLLGTLTYTIFDPIRALMIEGKLLEWFDYRKFKVYQWLRTNTVDWIALGFHSSGHAEENLPLKEVWKEREDAEAALKAYLTDMPTTIAFVHGPQGSGKSRMLLDILNTLERKTLFVDCGELHKATSDSQLIGSLARQTGYWPVFTFLNSLNNLIDLASVGLIGQKTGISSSVPDQLKQILNVVSVALKGVSASNHAAARRQLMKEHQKEIQLAEDERRREKLRQGTWHDGRLDCVAGNGVMSELGVGDESFDSDNIGISLQAEENDESKAKQRKEQELGRRQKTKEDMEAVNSLPVVVIKNFATKMGASGEETLNALSQWAAMLAENQIAHVIVISDNRENAKRLAKALPSKPLNSVALSDADEKSSLYFVRQKLRDAGVDVAFTSEQTTYIERLGGRASDLESLIHKVRNGQGIQDAVEDIINRSVSELRKNAFGDDVDDAKNLPWTREQVWKVLKLLAQKKEIPYYDILLEFPFKGDEVALRNMEHAELISILMHEGRPSSIRPGKPVFRWVFERLVNDKVFQATQDIALNEKLIGSSESTVKSCEEELRMLKEDREAEPRNWYDWLIGRKSACDERAKYVCKKMLVAERKIEGLERRNNELKKILASGGVA